jgi:hypothetical protein
MKVTKNLITFIPKEKDVNHVYTFDCDDYNKDEGIDLISDEYGKIPDNYERHIQGVHGLILKINQDIHKTSLTGGIQLIKCNPILIPIFNKLWGFDYRAQTLSGVMVDFDIDNVKDNNIYCIGNQYVYNQRYILAPQNEVEYNDKGEITNIDDVNLSFKSIFNVDDESVIRFKKNNFGIVKIENYTPPSAF